MYIIELMKHGKSEMSLNLTLLLSDDTMKTIHINATYSYVIKKLHPEPIFNMET